MLSSTKVEYESKMMREKKDNERRKNILILIYRHLINVGYCESAIKLLEESNLGLDKYDIADNIDLNMIIIDYENYFEQRFSKKPKLITNSHIASTTNTPLTNMSSSNKLPTINKKKTKETKVEKVENKNNNLELNLEIVNQTKMKEQKEDKSIFNQNHFNERKESILLKPLPDMFFNDELRELAAVVKREIIIENPNINFNDIVGVDGAKEIIKEALFLPMKYPDLFTGILEPWKGILLYGPPGTGKTMLAKAVSSQMPSTFFNISASTIVSKWRGDSEKIIRVLFDLARYYQPSTIFLDEIDSIMNQRSGKDEHDGSRRMKTELLIQLDGLGRKENERVFLLAASNLPWDLDQALLRRLEKRVMIGFPDSSTRESMLKKFIPENKPNTIDYKKFADMLEGYSGSDIKSLSKEILMSVVRRTIKHREQQSKLLKDKIVNNIIEIATSEDFQNAINKIKPSSVHSQEKYNKWMEAHGSN